MLHGRKRYEEHSRFLEWLLGEISEQKIDVLLVAGDIFDTRMPSNRAQELYYQFLGKVAQTACRHIIITSGNHDSPSFLDAPKALLRSMRVHVVGQSGEIKEQLIELTGRDGEVHAYVAAVPYLRDRDIRKAEAGESIDDKERKIVEGIRSHYDGLAELAEAKLKQAGSRLPVIAMGHLFASGGQVGDGVRDLYIGNLGSIGADTFSAVFDYVALGHLHVAQKIGGTEHVRYSGSPIPMGFGETGQQKKVLIFDTEAGEPVRMNIRSLVVPCFQQLLRLKGDLDELLGEISALKIAGSSAWLEINYTGTQSQSDLRNQLFEAINGSEIEILRVIDQTRARVLKSESEEDPESLDSLKEEDVFERCLVAYAVPDEECEGLRESFREIMQTYFQADHFAE